MAVAMDTPDFKSPYGSIHPRYKRQVVYRLALAGFAVAYKDESEGLWQGPLPTGFRLDGNNLVVTLAEGQVPIEARDTDTSTHYEVCCANDPALTCQGEGDGVNTRWELTQFVGVSGGDVTVSISAISLRNSSLGSGKRNFLATLYFYTYLVNS